MSDKRSVQKEKEYRQTFPSGNFQKWTGDPLSWIPILAISGFLATGESRYLSEVSFFLSAVYSFAKHIFVL